jgi:Cdc6-like AAA superfamily ATPase
MILKAIEGLEGREFILAEDVKDAYLAACERSGDKPKGAAQFTSFLKRLEAEGIISLRRMGCKNLGIKGQGSRVVVKSTDLGKEFLASHD